MKKTLKIVTFFKLLHIFQIKLLEKSFKFTILFKNIEAGFILSMWRNRIKKSTKNHDNLVLGEETIFYAVLKA